MRITIHLHSRPALTLEADPRQGARVVHKEPRCAWLSSTWDGSEPLEVCANWLNALLPENGKLERWLGDTQSFMISEGISQRPHIPESVLWLHAAAEFTGAVSISGRNPAPRAPEPIGPGAYPRLTERQVGRLLVEEAQLAGRIKGTPRRALSAPTSSLSGMRPKITLTPLGHDVEGGWSQGVAGQLNTWVVKLEHSREHPGEAGVEAICQNALALANVPASRTLSRVIDGRQCVLSERSDRQVVGGCVLPVHQEDWRQASGMGLAKHPNPVNPRDEWPFAYRILPESQHDSLTKLLAACWLLAHSDLHRGNLGFSISDPRDGPKTIALAPAYDVSSAVGTKLSRLLEFPIAWQSDTVKIGARQWMAHAKSCRIDVDQALQAVSQVAQALPDAFSQAVAAARTEHENIMQATVNRRCALVQKHAVDRARLFEAQLRRRWATLAFPKPPPTASPVLKPTAPALTRDQPAVPDGSLQGSDDGGPGGR